MWNFAEFLGIFPASGFYFSQAESMPTHTQGYPAGTYASRWTVPCITGD